MRAAPGRYVPVMTNAFGSTW